MKQTIQILALGMTLVSFTACMPLLPWDLGKKNTDTVPYSFPTPAPSNATTSVAPVVSGCDMMKADYRKIDNLVVEDPITVKIHRKNHFVNFKDCSGKVTDRSLQTLQAPRYSLDLKPRNNLGTVKGVEFINFQTCNSGGVTLPISRFPILGLEAVIGDSKGRLNLALDMATAWGTFRVNEGLNEIYYTYYKDCLEANSHRRYSSTGNRKTCVGAEVAQVGKFQVYVDYTEETVKEEKTVEASPEQCRREEAEKLATGSPTIR